MSRELQPSVEGSSAVWDLVTVRELVQGYLADRTSSEPALIGETLLLAEEHYVGRRFVGAEHSLLWRLDSDEVTVIDHRSGATTRASLEDWFRSRMGAMVRRAA